MSSKLIRNVCSNGPEVQYYDLISKFGDFTKLGDYFNDQFLMFYWNEQVQILHSI